MYSKNSVNPNKCQMFLHLEFLETNENTLKVEYPQTTLKDPAYILKKMT